MMMTMCLAAAMVLSASAQKLTPPPPPYDGNYPPPPPMPSRDACTSDSQCPLPCPMGQSGVCGTNPATGTRMCRCQSAHAPPMPPLPPPLPPPMPPTPALGGTSRCWTSQDGKTTTYTNGFPGQGWTLGCAPTPAPPPPPGAYPNNDAPTAANGARCGGFMEATTLSPRCMCGDSACSWGNAGWTCNCPDAPPAPSPGGSASSVNHQACLSCTSMGMYYGENGASIALFPCHTHTLILSCNADKSSLRRPVPSFHRRLPDGRLPRLSRLRPRTHRRMLRLLVHAAPAASVRRQLPAAATGRQLSAAARSYLPSGHLDH